MNASSVLSRMPTPTADSPESLAVENGEVIEVPLLLSGRQMNALEQAAYHHGLTAAEMVRQVLREFIAGQPRRAV